jgi:glyoxylase-like metal-dependent hydrolase (beta-lactamase superfamily II)
MITTKGQDDAPKGRSSLGKTGALGRRRAGAIAACLVTSVVAPVLGTTAVGFARTPADDAPKSVRVGYTNIYFIPCDGGWLQIDCGYPGDYEAYLKKTRKIGINTADVRYLLLTHHHDDHAGFAAELVSKQDVVVIVHEKALEPLRAGASEENIRPVNGCVKAVFSVFSVFHGGFTFPPFVPREGDLIVTGDNEDILKGIGIDGVILWTPGHTDDSISVVMSDGRAFVGDVAMNFLGICCIRHRPIYIRDIDQVFTAWERLKELGATTIYPAHGDPFPASELVPVR